MLYRILLLLLVASQMGAQEYGTLKIYISPPPETIMIDDEILAYSNMAILKPGKYFLKAWAPDRKLLDTIVEVKADQVTNFFYRMKLDKAYLDFQVVNDEYARKKTKHIGLPAMATALVAGSLVFTYIKGQSLYNETVDAYEEYVYAPYNIDSKAENFETAQSQYRGYVTAYYIEWGALAVCGYFLYKGIKAMKTIEQPVYKPSKNPLELNNVGMGRDRYGNYTIGFTFSIN